MIQPAHTPGPVVLDMLDDELYSSATNESIAALLLSKSGEANARLLAAAYNAFDSAARKLNVNAVEFAERMQEGGIAELVSAMEKAVHNAAIIAGKPGKAWEGDFVTREMIAALAKVKGGAA